MRNRIIPLSLLAVAALGACKKTADGGYEVQKPVIGTKTDTVHPPSVEVGTKKDTVTTPTVEVGKKKTEVTVPTVGIKPGGDKKAP